VGEQVPWHTWVRWLLAVLLVLGGLVIALLSSTGHEFRVCEDVVARVGKQPAVRSCRPLSITDAPVLLGLLLFVILILPDFTRISIVGFLALERKVAVQEDKTRFLESQVVALQTVQASASVIHTDTLYLQSTDDPNSLLAKIHEKEQKFGGT